MINNNEIKVIYVERKADLFGSCLSLLSMLEYLTKKGINPLVIVIEEGDLTEKLEERGIPYKIIKYYFNIWPRVKFLPDYLWFVPKIVVYQFCNILSLLKLRKIAKDFKADIIHTNIGPSHIGYSVAKSMRILHFWHLREYQDLDFGWKLYPSKYHFVKKLKSYANYNIPISKNIAKHFSLTGINYQIIPDGIFSKTETTIDFCKDKYFLFVGRIADFKGIKNILWAFSKFCENNTKYKLIIVGKIGSEEYKKELILCAKNEFSLGLIEFVGYKKDVKPLMRKATALIVASKMEGLGRVTIEAMFCGCLVVGKNIGGTKEILGEKQLGLLYNNDCELVTILQSLANTNLDSYKDRIKKAQKEAILLYSIEESGEKILNYYKQVIHCHKLPQKAPINAPDLEYEKKL
ncbi:glycosyltransferase family 4 protein [Desulfofustis glycolicus]|uniref:Glycosyltransferase involved in cell wall bisynthesis n=1 Tax=Desulfofustis glycolicus DSM 9705 TaxID=1121409 RepID=A0A1M5YTN7_9BACT|nr:glycosyltransferase family 4 protein [Desulfofustis glycolicus]SHI14943.1 Glycosyltransferase involved in cell wall bisynthesis [Desulfofustis glycolicus DSM 9705]